MVDEVKLTKQWHDDNPFYLFILLNDGRYVEQDLGESGWIARLSEAGFMRAPGNWYLTRKQGGVIALWMIVREGEQPYYVARHIGVIPVSAPEEAQTETIAYGIGKKRRDGHVDRLWILSNGCVMLGDDVEDGALNLLKRGILPPWTP